jgi:hypothetical protein
MKISAINSLTPANPIQPGPFTPPTPESESAAHDQAAIRRVAAMLSMLENKPEVRPEVLARGRALAAEPLYPPPEIIHKLAGLIAG